MKSKLWWRKNLRNVWWGYFTDALSWNFWKHQTVTWIHTGSRLLDITVNIIFCSHDPGPLNEAPWSYSSAMAPRHYAPTMFNCRNCALMVEGLSLPSQTSKTKAWSLCPNSFGLRSSNQMLSNAHRQTSGWLWCPAVWVMAFSLGHPSWILPRWKALTTIFSSSHLWTDPVVFVVSLLILVPKVFDTFHLCPHLCALTI